MVEKSPAPIGIEKLTTVRASNQKLYHGSIVPRQKYIHEPVRDSACGNGAYLTDNSEAAKAYATLKRNAREELIVRGDERRPTVYEVAVNGVFLDLRRGQAQLAGFLVTNREMLLALFDNLVVERESGQSQTLWEVEGKTFAERRKELECTLRILRKNETDMSEFEHYIFDILPAFLAQCGFSGRIDTVIELFRREGCDWEKRELTQWVVFNPHEAKVVQETPVGPPEENVSETQMVFHPNISTLEEVEAKVVNTSSIS